LAFRWLLHGNSAFLSMDFMYSKYENCMLIDTYYFTCP
jgi:hypothetical protein